MIKTKKYLSVDYLEDIKDTTLDWLCTKNMFDAVDQDMGQLKFIYVENLKTLIQSEVDEGEVTPPEELNDIIIEAEREGAPLILFHNFNTY